MGPRTYELDLYPDRSTDLHTRWFYFSVSNTRPGEPYTFLVSNMSVSAKSSMYHAGMQPVVLSRRAQLERGEGWRRSGTEVLYHSNGRRRSSRRRGTFHTLRFVLHFEYADDTVSVAPCVPYTYSHIREFLRSLSDDPTRAYRMRRRRLCSTLAGNACEVVTVTSFSSNEDDCAVPLAQRRGIVVTARVHPGEPQASWMMQGLLEFLTGPSLQAKQLRDHFVFKLVPVLNPDGVVVGNQRVNLSGADLNRRWDAPSKALHPTVYAAKSMIRQLQGDRELFLFADLHGHSKKRSVFLYGNCSAATSHAERLGERILPYLMQLASQGSFAYDNCKYKVEPGKSGSARVVVALELKVALSYTIEASYAGPAAGPHPDTHFSTRQLCAQGELLGLSLLQLCDARTLRRTFDELLSRLGRGRGRGLGLGLGLGLELGLGVGLGFRVRVRVSPRRNL